MKTAARAELLAIIDEMSSLAPDFRMGQMVNMFTGATDLDGHPNAVYEVEDEDLVIGARYYLEAFRKRDEEIRATQSPIASNVQQPITAS